MSIPAIRRQLTHPFFSMACIIGLMIIGVYLSTKWDPLYRQRLLEKEQKYFHILLKTSDFLHQRFISGDIEKIFLSGKKNQGKKIKCSEKIGNPEDLDLIYLRYNWDYVECYLKKWQIKSQFYYPISYNKEKFSVAINVLKVFPKIVVQLTLQDYPKSLWIELDPSARRLILPMGVYSYPTPELYYWDNLDKTIEVDMRPVSWGQIRDYNPKWLPPHVISRNLWAQSASYLTKEQMQEFCQAQNAQILQSHVFMALTAPKEEIRPHQNITVRDYSLVYISKISWNGLWMSKDSPLEYVDNLFHPQENVFDVSLPLNQKPKNIMDLDFLDQVAFRCMKITPQTPIIQGGK